MKKIRQLIFKCILISSLFYLVQQVSGQTYLYFISTPDSTAVINDQYSYVVESAANPTPVTFTLSEALDGMSITPVSPTTAEITWTPDEMSDGGRVVVHADNGVNQLDQTFFVYVTDEIACPADLISYWKLDETSGPVYSDFQGGYDATFVGDIPPTSNSGRVDNSLRFVPQALANTFLEVPDSNQYEWSGDDDFTISLWFKNLDNPFDPDQNEVFVGRNGTQWWWFGLHQTTKELTFEFWDGASVRHERKTAHPINDTSWHHAVFVFQGSAADQDYGRFYLDNSPQTKSYGGIPNNFSSDYILSIGYWDRFASNKFPTSGCIDEVLIYNKSLSPAEVADIYNDGLSGIPHCKPGNVAPLITSDPVTEVDEDDPYNYQLLYRDIDPGDIITLSALVLPSWLNFNTGTGLLSGNPENDHVGDTTLTLQVSDGSVDITQTFTLSVSNTNDAPVITTTAPVAVNEDEPYTYTLEAEDVDVGDNITLSFEEKPTWLSFNPSTGLLSGTPTNDEVGLNPTADFNVTLRATDLSSAYDEESFIITVYNINDAPVINSQNAIETDEDIAREIVFSDLNVTDVDDTYPSDFTLNVQNGNNYTRANNTITPTQNWYGELTVPITLSDGDSIVNFELDVTVNSVNDPPVFTSTPVTEAEEGSDYEYWFAATDVEDASLTFIDVKKPYWLDISSSSLAGILQGTPGYQDAGLDSVVLRVEDSEAAFDEQVFVINVEDVETGLKDNSAQLIYMVYPNPANRNERVTFELYQVSGKATLQIFNVLGELVTEIDILNEEVIKLNAGEFKAGLYLYKIINNNEYHTGQLLIK